MPRNKLRKTSRALIESAWKSGNRHAGEPEALKEEIVAPSGLPERRAQIMQKIEEIAARRVRVRSLRF